MITLWLFHIFLLLVNLLTFSEDEEDYDDEDIEVQDEEEIVVDEELHHGVQVEEVVNASMNDESNSNDALLEDEDENEAGLFIIYL